MIVVPGGTIGILGGGQLGRMLAMAAASLGYRVHIYAPEASGPAAEVAGGWTRGAYADLDALSAWAAACDVVTYEFENVDAAPLKALAARVPVHPAPVALDVAQDRAAEKRFAEAAGGRTARWRTIDSLAELAAAADGPAVLKTRRFGYDGKGQARLAGPADATAAWEAIGGRPAVLEALVPFEAEFSILLARGADGAALRWDAVTNVHRDGILERSTVPPAGIVAAQAEVAAGLVERIAGQLEYVGVLAVEFFATSDGPVFNEMAPRVHNSGHWTIEGAVTSQFENHLRAICGLPLGSTALRGAGAQMRNLIGQDVNQWPALLADPNARLHLYGKREARPGRKMGHVTRAL